MQLAAFLQLLATKKNVYFKAFTSLLKGNTCFNLALVTPGASQCLLNCGKQRMCTQVQPTLI